MTTTVDALFAKALPVAVVADYNIGLSDHERADLVLTAVFPDLQDEDRDDVSDAAMAATRSARAEGASPEDALRAFLAAAVKAGA